MKQELKKRIHRLILPIILGAILLIGVSYAWLTFTTTSTKSNTITAGNLSLVLGETAGSGITINAAYPMTDVNGLKETPYEFTLTNNGTIDSEYTIYLDDVTLDSGKTRLPDGVIKHNLEKGVTSLNTALLTTTGTNPNRVLDSGMIKAGESYSYKLRLWLDENMTNSDVGKQFKGKIRVVASQIIEKLPTPETCFTTDETGTIITGYICGPTLPIVYMNESENLLSSSKPNTNEVNTITEVVIPKTIKGKEITRIGYTLNEAMAVCASETDIFDCISNKAAFLETGITEVVIPEGITAIGAYAFATNPLTSVSLPKGLQTIDEYAFSNNKLVRVTLPDGLQTIGIRVFWDNELTSVIIPNSVTKIDEGAFEANKLTSVTIPDSVIEIGYSAFANNELTSVTIPSSVTNMGDLVFSSNKLISVIIKGKSSPADFDVYYNSIFEYGWAPGYSDANIIWNG